MQTPSNFGSRRCPLGWRPCRPVSCNSIALLNHRGTPSSGSLPPPPVSSLPCSTRSNKTTRTGIVVCGWKGAPGGRHHSLPPLTAACAPADGRPASGCLPSSLRSSARRRRLLIFFTFNLLSNTNLKKNTQRHQQMLSSRAL